MPRYQPLNPKILLTPSHKSRRSVDLQAKTGRSRSRRSVERKQTKLLSLCSVNIHRFNNRLCLVSLSLSLSHIMLVYAFDTREPSPPRPPRIGRSKVRSVARSMTWKASAEFRLNAIICIFIRGRHAATMKPAILKSVSPSSRKSTEKKFRSIPGYIPGARDFLARDGPWRSFVPNFIGVSSFLPRLIFV